jgi:hypothetical protein
MAQFQVNEVFEIESRDLFVLVGQITEGEILAGMTVLALEHSATLHSVEFVRRQGGGDDIGLCLKLRAKDREVWRSLELRGSSVIVS